MNYSSYIMAATGCQEEEADLIEAEMKKKGNIEWLDLEAFNEAAISAADRLSIPCKTKN